MAELHFNEFPYGRNLFGVQPDEVKDKFEGWEKKANYHVRQTVILQVDTTNVSQREYSIAPNINFLAVNQAIINIFKSYSLNEVSFSEFQEYYGMQEAALEKYSQDLVSRLNSARFDSGLTGEWYVNYGLNERHISVSKG